MLVDGVDAVNRDARLAAVAAADGDAGVAALRGIERASFLDLDAGLQLRQLEIVASVQRQLVDLFQIDDAADRHLRRIDGDAARLDFDFLAEGLDRHGGVDARRLSDGDDQLRRDEVREALMDDGQHVLTGLQRGDHEEALIVRRRHAIATGRDRRGRHRRAFQHRAAGVRDDTGNGPHRRLCEHRSAD